jgi:hypothetical protein
MNRQNQAYFPKRVGAQRKSSLIGAAGLAIQLKFFEEGPQIGI